ncbi:uncharacterized protein B0H18DRAFT_1126483 [Fomitopsis serialis]|uniref:uncharacterized protein n=1 Tax=Fomitopsis serialis TaxID=139415 RepID=UPI0020074A56|nr:uncharacterized protein B0H18DRAFT_1126483 [Neoantrodia serialis]KAH9913200.1 hypothetical protein B0H18DRAFT_1126483 [Neoantrodia serialis]
MTEQDSFATRYWAIRGALRLVSDGVPSPLEILDEMGHLEREFPQEVYVMEANIHAMGYEEIIAGEDVQTDGEDAGTVGHGAHHRTTSGSTTSSASLESIPRWEGEQATSPGMEHFVR